MMVPDQVMGEVYFSSIEPFLKSGQTILFSHGYNIHYSIIKPPGHVNVVLVAPSGAGSELRKRYVDGKGIPGLFAIDNNYSGEADKVVLCYC